VSNSRFQPAVAILCLLTAPLAFGHYRNTRLIPTLAKAPRLDGDLSDFASALSLKSLDEPKTSSAFTAKVAYHGTSLFLAVAVSDERVTAGDILNVALYFPGAGTTARGYTYRFAADGKRAPAPDSGTPGFANGLIDAAIQKTTKGLAFELALPARALPRFPAWDPVVLELCLTYEDRDQVAGAPTVISNCKNGSMVEDALRFPDGFRRSLKLDPPQAVVGIEGRDKGWVGFARLHYPAWISCDVELTPELLKTFLLDEVREPTQSKISLPARMKLPDGRPIYSVLTGKDPFAAETGCNAETELRLGLYVIKDRTAGRVLEWPAATCILGRTISVVLDDQGALTLGYSNGATINFIWSNDHFERTEIG